MDKGRISLSPSVLNFPVSTDGKKYGEGEEEEREKLLKESQGRDDTVYAEGGGS